MLTNKNNNFSSQFTSALLDDSVVIFPTETLYGIGCSIESEKAIGRVFEIKGRALNQPPPILIADEIQLNVLVKETPTSARALMQHFWPGSLTLVLPARDEIFDALCGFNQKGNTRTIAVRRTAHPLAAALCQSFGAPIVATSANFSGAVGRAAHPQILSDIPIALQLMTDLALDGGEVGGISSTIVDCTCKTPRILRAGAISFEELQNVCPNIQQS